jgi:hypothetical protein
VNIDILPLVAGASWSGASGKAVRIGRGRAAVTGDDRRKKPLSGCGCRMGRRGGRTTRKPEDLPATCLVWLSRSEPSGSFGAFSHTNRPRALARREPGFFVGRSRLAATLYRRHLFAAPSRIPTNCRRYRPAPWPIRRSVFRRPGASNATTTCGSPAAVKKKRGTDGFGPPAPLTEKTWCASPRKAILTRVPR